jgi:CheY-like chemotaxis protein
MSQNKNKMMSLLIVEDDATLLSVLKDIFESLNVQVTCSSNGQEAVDILKQVQFDVIMSDIKMPKMDGLCLLKTLKDLKITTPVVIMSGYSEYKDEQISYSGGVVLLEKPFNKAKIVELYNNYMVLLLDYQGSQAA